MPELMSDHLTLFVDLLGFSDIISRNDEASRNRVLSLLLAISQMRGEFSDQTTDVGSGTRRVQIKPTITTFSDHIVASYPVDRLLADDRSMALQFAMLSCAQFVAKVAATALTQGFLVRGGLSYGSLFHISGVVFGPAMIEAYKLESRSANNACVAVSPQLASNHNINGLFIRGKDGLAYLNYHMFMLGALSPSGSDYSRVTKDRYVAWVGTLRDNVLSLRDAGRESAAAKWLWFSRDMLASLRNIRPEALPEIDLGLLAWADEISIYKPYVD